MKGDNKLMKDLYFLICNNDERLELVYKRDGLMKDIIDESKRVAGIEAIDLFLTDEEMIANDQKFFRKEGYKEGAKDKTIQIAKNLLTKNVDLDIILETTGLSKEELNKISVN